MTDENGPQYVPPEERIAVFDNDGTLWCEKPMYIQLDFLLRKLAAQAENEPNLRQIQPWKAAWQKDFEWLGAVITKHYQGDDRDFMWGFAQDLYAINRQRVIGSTVAYHYVEDELGTAIVQQPELDVIDDGPGKPIRIWNVIGQRPILAAGNSNGYIEMLKFTQVDGKSYLNLLLLHDDALREFAYTQGAERALREAAENNWHKVVF